MTGLPWHEPEDWPQDAQSERIIGDWQLYQRQGGHRTSTDDVLTAWFAASRTVQSPPRYLDLGCGVASVLFMVAHRLRPGQSVGIEAQPQSYQMACRSIAELPEGAPSIRVVHHDFRQRSEPDASFDLITGSPPYFPLGTGSLPADPQRRACRFEARGGVEAYCETAASYLAPHGAFYFVFQTTWDERALAAIEAAGLHLRARVDARMRSDRDAPFLTVYETRFTPGPVEAISLAIREADGSISSAYHDARVELGVAQAGVMSR